jgi:hypothetical protein
MIGANGLPSARYSIRPLNIGAGGWVTKLKFAADGQAYCGHDTWGMSRLDNGWWKLLVTEQSGFATAKIDPYEGSINAYDIGVGVGGRLYLFAGSLGTLDGAIYRSNDYGETWTRTSLFNVFADGNPPTRFYTPHLEVDPGDHNVCYAGTQNGKVIRTLDGWTTHAEVASFTTGYNSYNPKGVLVAIDASSSLTSGRRTVIFAAGDGDQVRKSTNGGDSFAALTGGPTTHCQMAVDSQGTLWHTDGGGVLRKLVGTTWTTVSVGFGDLVGIAIDPTTPGRMAVADSGGRMALSTNYGSTWIACAYPNARRASDVPWLEWTDETFMSCGTIAFDPVVAGRLWFSQGIGVWQTRTALPTTAGQTLTFHSVSAGIEQMVSSHAVKPAGKPWLLAFYDRGLFREVTNDTFPLRHDVNQMSHAMGLAKSPQNEQFIVYAMSRTVDRIRYSTNGGDTFSDVANIPTFSSGGFIGNVAASRDGQFIGVPWSGDDGKLLFWQSPAAVPVELTHSDFVGDGWGHGLFVHQRLLCADQVTPGVFYAYHRPIDETNLGGLFRITVSADGATRTVEKMTVRLGADFFHVKLRAVPGHAGHLFFAQGHLGSPSTTGPSGPTDVSRLKRSTDGGATFVDIAGFREIYDIGCGKPAPGQTYPSLMLIGYYNGVHGVWITYDNFTTVSKVADWPGGRLDPPRYVEGDMEVFGSFRLGFDGTSVMRADYADARTLIAA